MLCEMQGAAKQQRQKLAVTGGLAFALAADKPYRSCYKCSHGGNGSKESCPA